MVDMKVIFQPNIVNDIVKLIKELTKALKVYYDSKRIELC